MSVRIRPAQGDQRVVLAAQRSNGLSLPVGSPDELRRALVQQRVAWAQAAAAKPLATAKQPAPLPATLPVTPRELVQQQAATQISASLATAAEHAVAKLNEAATEPSFEDKVKAASEYFQTTAAKAEVRHPRA